MSGASGRDPRGGSRHGAPRAAAVPARAGGQTAAGGGQQDRTQPGRMASARWRGSKARGDAEAAVLPNIGRHRRGVPELLEAPVAPAGRRAAIRCLIACDRILVASAFSAGRSIRFTTGTSTSGTQPSCALDLQRLYCDHRQRAAAPAAAVRVPVPPLRDDVDGSGRPRGLARIGPGTADAGAVVYPR